MDVGQRVRRRPERPANAGDDLLRDRLEAGDRLLLVPRVWDAAERRSPGHRHRRRLRRSAARQRLRVRARQPGAQVRPTTLPRHTAPILQVVNYLRGICCHRVSIRLSVTSRSSTKTAKRRITQTTSYDKSTDSSLLRPNIMAKFQLSGASNRGEVG